MNLGVSQSRFIPQLFYAFKNNCVGIVDVNIVDDILSITKKEKTNKFIFSLKIQYKLRKIAHGSGSLVFNRLYIVQDNNFVTPILGESKLESLNCFPIDRIRHKQVTETLNAVEFKDFRSVNSSTG